MNYNKIIIHTDGGARGNPGPAAVGVVIEKAGEQPQFLKKTIGETTNNVAEYTAVKTAFEALVGEGSRGVVVEVYLDSLLVTQQLSGVYKIKHNNLRDLAMQVKHLEKQVGERVTYHHIPREENKVADRLVNEALDS